MILVDFVQVIQIGLVCRIIAIYRFKAELVKM